MASQKSSGKKKSQQGQLRIVAGKWRNRLLQIGDVPGLRPSSERVRETLFNWLTPKIHGSTCLDLCAGTGALGLEALSRGASRAVFVEMSPVATKTLKSNIAALGATGAQIINADARRYLQGGVSERFDIVFLDPPFAAVMLDELCRLLSEHGWLAEGARMYLEMDRKQAEPVLPGGWQILKDKTAGNVRYMLVAEGARE